MTLTKSELEREDFYNRMDQLPARTPVTTTLVALNLLVFVAMLVAGAGLLSHDGVVAVRFGSNLGRLTMSGQWWRLFTSIFIHFGLLHIALNMAALYQTGRTVERMYGSAHFLVLYLFSGLCGSMVSILWHPAANSAGASGAIFGVFGGLLAFLLSSDNAIPRSVALEHRSSTVAFVGFNLVSGFILPGVDNGAHIGGLLGGLAIGFLLARPIDLRARLQSGKSQLLLSSVAGVLILGALFYMLVLKAHAGR
ncbi:MAG: rhomboid family intramembrane serine protease [Sphingomonadaceae bacterium]